ncbi:hypothetical protein BD626DRAFT_515882 [Schizophyllum amplum]|uniref:Uncharacterized protein n=1 Tax=Schizophyllum amplum TaxID=97359 RepID=A0A550BXF5_9AGAR|nr:hypothetical protein BD626DRAFT_515882 [Auriculariopsis ampla]
MHRLYASEPHHALDIGPRCASSQNIWPYPVCRPLQHRALCIPTAICAPSATHSWSDVELIAFYYICHVILSTPLPSTFCAVIGYAF